MARIIEGTPGQEAEVWIQDRGAPAASLRATIVIEDLSDVLTCISARSGANGPNSFRASNLFCNLGVTARFTKRNC